MANNKNLIKDNEKTRFSKENQPENRGRKPSALRFIREEGVSITDIKRIIESLIWGYDSEELAVLLQTVKVKGKDGKTLTKTREPVPMGINLILGALNNDLKNKSINNFDKLMDRVYGKATQPVDLPPGSNMTMSMMSPEERDKRIEELLKECEPPKAKRK